MKLTRRDALKGLLGLGASMATSAQGRQDALAGEVQRPLIIENPRHNYPNQSYTEALYRSEFAEVFGSVEDHGVAYHCVNCQGNCAWKVWAKDGKVTRESQAAAYPSIRDDIPDFNPRGCNKGAQHSQIMENEDRLHYPMKRAGARGEGKWTRITWDQAIEEVAENLYRTMLRVGPGGNYIHMGAGVISEGRGASFKRLGTLLGAVRPYIASYVGDMFPGTSVVYGEGNVGCSYDFVYNTDGQVYWGCNPNVTRIPDAHFIWEGKYNGSKVIVISPEFNATAIHADLWIPINAGYDGHLALSIMHEMMRQELIPEDRVKTFTDLPFLVRKDTQTLLRLADIDLSSTKFDGTLHQRFLEIGEGEEVEDHAIFFVWNQNTNKLTSMPGSEGSPLHTLRLQDLDWNIDPALNGEHVVTLKDGIQVTVEPVFAAFRRQLEDFTPQKTQPLTGVHPEVVSQLARDLSVPDVVSLTIGFSLGKHFNGMLTQRAISSLVALTGRLGDAGGLNTENEWSISGLGGLSGFAGKYRQRFASGCVSEFLLGDGFKTYQKAFSEADVQASTGHSKDDYQATIQKMLDKSLNDEGWMNGKSHWDTVETFVVAADAMLRRNKGSYREAFFEKVRFFAYADFRMSETALYADILLPTRSHYEVWDVRMNPGYHRFANIAQPPRDLKPIGEARTEWDIATAIVEKIQALALAEHDKTGDPNTLHIPDSTHSDTGVRELDQLVETFTDHGQLGTDKQALEYVLANVPQFQGETITSAFERGGFMQINEKGGKSSPLYPHKPYNTFENHAQLLSPFETLSGRLTFYVDHPLWISAGAALPTATTPLKSARYPLLLMTPHARWSIHSTYKTSATLLRLQRGKPYVMLSPDNAQKRGIKDGVPVIMFNELAEVQLMAKIAPGVPDNSVVMEHGWEPFMYKGKVGHNALIGDMLNLLEISEGWGHLKFGINWDGNQHAYTGAVELRLA